MQALILEALTAYREYPHKRTVELHEGSSVCGEIPSPVKILSVRPKSAHSEGIKATFADDICGFELVPDLVRSLLDVLAYRRKNEVYLEFGWFFGKEDESENEPKFTLMINIYM